MGDPRARARAPRQAVEIVHGRPRETPSASRPYGPLGAAWILWQSTDPEILLSGPAGTGKSRACLEKLHYLAETVPGIRCLIARKTRASLTESALVTFENQVLPERHPLLRRQLLRSNRRCYIYPNGSEISVAGLDNPIRVMSTEYDVAYIQEAIELNDVDWELITTRMRNGRLSYQQVIADTNPASPKHWLKQRCDRGFCRLLDSRHEDNPVLWREGGWTDRGRAYIANLERLSGARYQRLRHGRWVQAEGVVYDKWDASVHIVDRFPIPREWPRLWSVDFGFTNPFVWQAWAIDPDGRLILYREIYHTHRLVEDHCAAIRRACKDDPPPDAVVCDHDAEDRATLERKLGILTLAAHKGITDGIQAVTERLRPAGDGRPRLTLMRDSLVDLDPELAEARKPTCTADEMDAYIWDVRQGRAVREAPLKENDHGMDALRYLVAYVDNLGMHEVWGDTL